MMAHFIRTPILATAFLLSALPFLAQSVEAKSTFMAECSAKYKAAKADGSVDAATKWTDFMKNQCKDLQTDATAVPDATVEPAPVAKVTKAKVTKKNVETPAEATATTPSGSFIKDCSAAWKTMKTNNTVPEGMTWKAFVSGKCVATPAAAPVEAAAPDATFMEKCATDWKAMKASFTVPEGLTWKTFVKGKCVEKPMATKVAAKKKTEAPAATTTADAGTETFIQKCGTDWKAMKAAGTVPEGLTWKAFVTGKCVAKPAGAATAGADDGKAFMKKCGDDWKAMKASGTVPDGLKWKDYVKGKCVVDGVTPVMAKKDATQPDEPTTMVLETGDLKTVDKNGKAFTSGQMAAHKRIRICANKWRAAKASGTIAPDQKWPQFWSACNAELKAALQ